MQPLVLLLLFASTILAGSSEFSLSLYAPNTTLSEAYIYVEDSVFYISNTTEDSLSGSISANGTLTLSTGEFIGMDKNYLILTTDPSVAATPFSITSDMLMLYGYDFHAVPSGKDGIYVLGTINAAASREGVITVGIEPLDDDGEVVSDYSPYANGGAAASAAMSSTKVTAIVSNTEVGDDTGSSSSNGAAGQVGGVTGIAAMLGAWVLMLI